jgi:hypothetical protein
MPICLSPEELEDYTRKVKFSAQARVLDVAGVPYRKRPDGSLIVLRVHVDYETEKKQPPSPEVCL